MSLWSRALGALGLGLQERDLASDMIGWHDRTGRRVGSLGRVSPDSALKHSAVWACLRLRADLISSMPVDVFRQVGGVLAEVTKPGWLNEPFPGIDITEWLWSTQFDLDRYGNAFSLITGKDAAGRPAQLELLSAGEVGVLTSGRRITGYRLGSDVLDPSLIWHERQFTPAGSPLGLSPIAYAAMSISGYLSAQQFALDWFSTGAQPSGVLKNIAKTVDQTAAATMKSRFKVATEGRDIFVTGNDWEWTPSNGDASSAAFLDQMRYGIPDICRFLGVPGDMIDAPVDGSAVTYANVTQRNLQLLVINLGPAVIRRERALSRALATPRIVKLNSDATTLRMDPQTRSAVLNAQVAARAITPSERRALDNRAPFTEADLAEFDALFGAPKADQPQSQARMGSFWVPPNAEMHEIPVYEGYANDLPRERAAITSGWAPPTEGNGR